MKIKYKDIEKESEEWASFLNTTTEELEQRVKKYGPLSMFKIIQVTKEGDYSIHNLFKDHIDYKHEITHLDITMTLGDWAKALKTKRITLIKRRKNNKTMEQTFKGAELLNKDKYSKNQQQDKNQQQIEAEKININIYLEVEYQNCTKTIKEWSELMNVPLKIIKKRYEKNNNLQDIFIQPPDSYYKLIVFNKEINTIKGWAKEYVMRQSELYFLLNSGYSIEEALITKGKSYT